ncbi:Probable lipoprotein precursor [Tenacibaculum maritimum]|nr:Probable lipoprotein precursor [Tenacibaculum maritimum]
MAKRNNKLSSFNFRVMKNIYILILIAFALSSCKNKKEENNAKEYKKPAIEAVEEHTAELALDWNGVYKGLLPCASCPGILSTVKLKTDKTYVKSDFYVGSEQGYFNDEGTFYFTKDGGRIILNSKKDTLMYQVGESRLFLLNKKGKKDTSSLANRYELMKMSDKEVLFSKTPIKGYLTIGEEVAVFEPLGSSKVYWVNDLKEGSLTKLYQEKTKNEKAPYVPVMATLVARKSKILRQGLRKKHDDVIDVLEIKSVKLLTEKE